MCVISFSSNKRISQTLKNLQPRAKELVSEIKMLCRRITVFVTGTLKTRTTRRGTTAWMVKAAASRSDELEATTALDSAVTALEAGTLSADVAWSLLAPDGVSDAI